MRSFSAVLLLLVFVVLFSSWSANAGPPDAPASIFGFPDSAVESAIESKFLSVPDARLAGEHLRILTQAPHIAGSPEDKATADYVAQKFRDAGLETEISEYKVWMNYPLEMSVDITAPADLHMHGPAPERVEGDSFQDDPRVVMPFNGMSPSGDVEADVVYANYGTPEDFKRLEQMKVSVRGKLVLVRYGENFRGVKVFVAQQHGAAGVLIYSDPYDDGWRRGDKYPAGPWHPDSAVQRGSVGFMFEFAGDPTTPGVASTPALADSQRTSPECSAQLPKIPSTPISYAEASPILEHLAGPESPREWQGSLPFTYHVGAGPVRVRLHSKQDYQYRTIWDVTGRVRGADSSEGWVLVGNHRDAWVYGAVDPGSGTAAMLESVHGVGDLLKSGWKPKRSIVFASWDAEEEGLIGSTEWGEQHEPELAQAVAYFNVDVGVNGPKFGASAVPTLKQFVRDITKAVPDPTGGTVYEAWQRSTQAGHDQDSSYRPPAATIKEDVPVGDLGSGSDYTVFLQHLGVPASDMGSTGPYGVYHSVFDNFQWFTKFGDPTFVYEQEIARILGLQAVRMANADALPLDYEQYGKEIAAYIDAARKRAEQEFAGDSPSFSEAAAAAARFEQAGAKLLAHQRNATPTKQGLNALNQTLRDAERALLMPAGLPNRPWYRHAIYAPGEYTGYAAVVIPGVNEAIDQHDSARLRGQLGEVTAAIDRAAKLLANYH